MRGSQYDLLEAGRRSFSLTETEGSTERGAAGCTVLSTGWPGSEREGLQREGSYREKATESERGVRERDGYLVGG